MEEIKLSIDPTRFDQLVHGLGIDPGLPQHGSLDAAQIEIAAKAGCTTAGEPGVVISFYSVLPNGRPQRVQAVTTLRALVLSANALAVHPDLQ